MGGWRVDTHVLLDVIGAHAATEGMTLVTRDRGHAHYFQVLIEDPSPGGRTGQYRLNPAVEGST